MTRKTLVRVALAALTSAAVLTGCGGDPSTGDNAETNTETDSKPAAADYNEADVIFLQQMIPHHAQAVSMADLVEGRTTTTTVVDLATRIKEAQDPEIEQMTGWLTEWGKPTAAPDAPSGEGGHSGDHGAGMMSDDQLAQLEHVSGADFDRHWLTMMIEHHEGAVAMAQTLLTEGGDAEVKELARRIIDAQQKEIGEMRALL